MIPKPRILVADHTGALGVLVSSLGIRILFVWIRRIGPTGERGKDGVTLLTRLGVFHAPLELSAVIQKGNLWFFSGIPTAAQLVLQDELVLAILGP